MKKKTLKKNSLASIGERMRDVRVFLEVSVIRAASTLQIKPEYLTKIENGYVRPSFDLFLKMIEKYDINPNYLLLGIGNMALKGQCPSPAKDINLDTGIDSLRELEFLFETSQFFKHNVFKLANMFLFENIEIIRRDIKTNTPGE